MYCQICSRPYHSAINCWNIFDFSYQSEETPQALAALSLNDTVDDTFYVDSGATSHMTNNAGKLLNPKIYEGPDTIYVGNGNELSISHIGNAHMFTKHGKLLLKDVLEVPELKKNLLSVGQLTSDNSFVF